MFWRRRCTSAEDMAARKPAGTRQTGGRPLLIFLLQIPMVYSMASSICSIRRREKSRAWTVTAVFGEKEDVI